MSSVTRFLETLSCNPVIAAMPDAYARSVADLQIDDHVRSALMARDAAGLVDLLGGQSKMFCLIATPDEPEEIGKRRIAEQM